MSSGQGKFPLEVVTDNNLLRQRYEDAELEGKLPLYVTTTSAQGIKLFAGDQDVTDQIGAGAGPSASAWTPADLYAGGEGGAWYDATDPLSVYASLDAVTPATVGGQVKYIADKSPNHVDQSTSTAYPTWNGSGLVSAAAGFGGESVNVSSAAVVTSFIAFRALNATTTASLLSMGSPSADAANAFGLYINNGSNATAGAGVGKAGAYAFINSGMILKAGEDVVLIHTYDPSKTAATDKIAAEINGAPGKTVSVAVAGTVAGNLAANPLWLFSRSGNTIPCPAGSVIYQAGIIGRALTADERDKLASYLLKSIGKPEKYPNTLIPAATNYVDTSERTARGDWIETSEFARLIVKTDATELAVDLHSTIAATFGDTVSVIGVNVNGVYHGQIGIAANGRATVAYSLPSGADKTVEFVVGPQSITTGPRIGTYIRAIRANASLVVQTPPASNELVIYGDSIAGGSSATPITKKAWAMQLRSVYPGSVRMEAYGARTLWIDCKTAAGRAAVVSRIAKNNPSKVWLCMGTNDYALNVWTAPDFGTAYAALLDDLHAALPSAQIYAQTPIVRTTETANGLGFTAGDYRTQISTAAAARPGWVTLVDGTAAMLTTDLVDGVHPTTGGHDKYFSDVRAVLGV